jgi:hypothetical protein
MMEGLSHKELGFLIVSLRIVYVADSQVATLNLVCGVKGLDKKDSGTA